MNRELLECSWIFSGNDNGIKKSTSIEKGMHRVGSGVSLHSGSPGGSYRSPVSLDTAPEKKGLTRKMSSSSLRKAAQNLNYEKEEVSGRIFFHV